MSSTPYADLTPDVVLEAVDSLGHVTDGRILALNSYENRVYQLGLEEGGFVVTKFYRPERWTDAAILEEHAFALELCEHEIPVVAPLVAGDGTTLHEHEGFRFAVFPRQGGRWPEMSRTEEREWMGKPWSVEITLPPLAGIVLKPAPKELTQEEDNAPEVTDKANDSEVT